MVQILFLGPVRFKGHFEEIDNIAKVLLGTKPHRVRKLRDVDFRCQRKCGKRKKRK